MSDKFFNPDPKMSDKCIKCQKCEPSPKMSDQSQKMSKKRLTNVKKMSENSHDVNLPKCPRKFMIF